MVIYFCLVFFVTSLLAFGLSRLNITSNYDSELLSAYECGFNPFSDTRSGFDVKFYLIAIFFIIFDLEIVLLFPLVVYITNLTIFQFSIIMFFLFQLGLGLIYEYFSGSLDWSHDLSLSLCLIFLILILLFIRTPIKLIFILRLKDYLWLDVF